LLKDTLPENTEAPMYVPRFNVMDAPGVRRLVAAVGSADLVTVGREGYPTSTLLPVVWDDDRLVLHMARANPHWQSIEPDAPALAIVTGPQAYVSPAWYPSTQEHGRMVPTWNYTAVHFTGRVRVHDDAGWVRDAVTRLTTLNEKDRNDPWAVEQAPDPYIEQQLRAIVGIELVIEKVEGKAKLSQNRSAEDHAGVVTGLRREGGSREHEVAELMNPE
jgi:transcriptional regulator